MMSIRTLPLHEQDKINYGAVVLTLQCDWVVASITDLGQIR